MEDRKLSRMDRVKSAFENNRTLIVAGTGFVTGVAATLWCIERPERYPFGSSYSPQQPIAHLLLNEEQIKRRIAAGILFDLFIRDQQLTEEFTEFAQQLTGVELLQK